MSVPLGRRLLQTTDRAQALLRLETVNIYLRQDDLAAVPRAALREPFQLRQMDHGSARDVGIWLEIHNQAFNRVWERTQFERKVVNHGDVDTVRTNFIMEDGSEIGATSIGVWRRNRDVGVGHYGAIRPSHQDRKLGKWLFQSRLNWLADMGLSVAEGQTTLAHPRSVMIHFDLGYRLKDGPDAWNTPDRYPAFVRRRVNERAQALFAAWEQRAGVTSR